MFTNNDIAFKTIFVINCIEQRTLRVSNGELLLEETDNHKTLTKIPFQKVLALFVIGHISITTPLIEKCKRYNVALVVMKPNLRPVFFWAHAAEANYLLRQRQYQMKSDDLSIAKQLVTNKIENQYKLLCNTRLKSKEVEEAKQMCIHIAGIVHNATSYNDLMGLEGAVAKSYFKAYFGLLGWTARKPRAKTDAINATLDIGYTILFNYIEVYVRMFGFDTYVGVYHRLWFKRKSLICDLMEPFRCIIDAQVRKAFNLKQCKESDFKVIKNEYILKRENNAAYQRLFFDALIARKMEVFAYVQTYYRCFMQRKSTPQYPHFKY